MVNITGTFEEFAIVMDEQIDQVAVAKKNIPPGSCLKYKDDLIEIRNVIKRGHRFALTNIDKGRFVKQYGYPFGESKGILKGEMITVSNINNTLPEISLKSFKTPERTVYKEKYLNRLFNGYKRKNGAVGTRNYFLIVPTSMCVSEMALQVVLNLEKHEEILHKYPNIDGIVAIPHTEGCGCAANEQIDRVLQVLKGFVLHPNVGGCLIMDMGCEQTNYEKVYSYLESVVEERIKPIDWITIQTSGGTRAVLEKSFSMVLSRLSEVNKAERVPCSVEHLVVGTECGASDSFSGITANPVIGNVVDKVIYGKGSAILSEVPEMLGTFDMLLPRFRSTKVAKNFLGAIDWYVSLARKLDTTLDDNLVPENKEGGLINNFIKSLGAVIKGGSTTIEDVIDYGESLRTKGLTIMQGPGGDLESVTGIVASGATIVCFSTGKGTITGNAICPVIKVASTDELTKALPEDIDFNAGSLLTENMSIDALGEELFEMILRVASGEKTWSEKWRQRQFQIWTAGKLSL